MSEIVKMANGRLTLPVDIRRALGVGSDETFEVEAAPEQDALILRPATVLRRADAWAYTPEHRALLARAHADSTQGRVHRLTEEELTVIGQTQ
ncbi:MAG: hypothetical protein DLM55_09990 [Acidimicrobiales bacterium]|nr:MAG: hypothetical protein DLM55_09990 [Acidimicrobiales bacterium]